jgi:putative ABC transport system permease protein
LSLGGSRGAILRALIAEHLVLAVGAAAGGVLLANWILPSLVALAPPGLVGGQAVSLDRQVAAWSVIAALVTTLLAGMIPAAAIARTRPGHALKLGAREVTRGSRWRHRLVVTAQFGLALILLAGAGLFGETLLRLSNEPLGFSPDGVAAVAVTRSRRVPAEVATPAERAKLQELRRTDIDAMIAMAMERTWRPMQTMIDRLSAHPGVRSVAVSDAVPFTASQPRSIRLRAEGRPVEEAIPLLTHFVSKDYFQTMGIRVLAGKAMELSTDPRGTRLTPATAAIRRPIVVSASAARRLAGDEPVGKTLQADKALYEIIGVVDDVKHKGLLDAENGAVYFMVGSDESIRQVVVRAAGDVQPLLPELRKIIETNDVPMFVTSTSPLRDLVSSTIVVERSRALLAAVYGLAALLLAAVGLYGLAARLVSERRREIGIRIALGAGRRDVRRLVMTDAGMIVGLGLLMGIPAAIATSRFAQSMLYGVTPTAPHVFGTAALTLAAAALVATIVPAWRATRIDPAVTLREE